MTHPPLTPGQFDALCEIAGIAANPERRERLRAVQHLVEAMRARVWQPDLRFQDEPAVIFAVAPGPQNGGPR